MSALLTEKAQLALQVDQCFTPQYYTNSLLQELHHSVSGAELIRCLEMRFGCNANESVLNQVI